MAEQNLLVIGCEDLGDDSFRIPESWAVVRCDVESALDTLRQSDFRVVVTTASATTSDQLELLRQIRKTRPDSRVIILTKESTTEDILTAIREQAFALLTLPAEPFIVERVLNAALEEESSNDGIQVISSLANWITLRARCDRATAERIVLFCRELRSGLPLAQREELGIAFREILMNAVEHGANFDPNKFVEVHAARTRRAIVYAIRDPGEGFSPDSLDHCALSNPDDDPTRHSETRESKGMRAGGFGLLIAKSFVDELMFNEKRNEVLLIKYTDVCSPSNHECVKSEQA
ncbi:MAG TPA: ATP-binding protein [Bryobacteraceae bacterium]|jgi:anti-sigma regulatory factor (Ser/Thr protein kinase)/CheY-like chemotaxis protein|nr:ATP-binding protein [Bryobacteraceae bacterium]